LLILAAIHPLWYNFTLLVLDELAGKGVLDISFDPVVVF
jgi:hypothetical protein